MQRKPSHFGSNNTAPACGRSRDSLASIGSIGGCSRSVITTMVARSGRECSHATGDSAHAFVHRQLTALAGGALLSLDDTAREPFRADDELDRHADEVGVGELHAGTHVTVVVENVDAGIHEVAIYALRGVGDVARGGTAAR